MCPDTEHILEKWGCNKFSAGFMSFGKNRDLCQTVLDDKVLKGVTEFFHGRFLQRIAREVGIAIAHHGLEMVNPFCNCIILERKLAIRCRFVEQTAL